MVQSSRLDVLMVHAEVVRDLVEHRVMHLVHELLTRPAPPFDVVLEEHDPLRIHARAEGRVVRSLEIPQHTLVDPPGTVIVGGLGLNGDQEVIGVHPSAERGRDALESVSGDALELVCGDLIRHPLRMSHAR